MKNCILLLLTTFALSPAWANFCQLNGCLEAGAALLYWVPAQKGLQLGEFVQTASSTTRQEQLLKPHYSLGFSLWAGYYSCDGCNFSTLSWTHLCTSRQLTLHGPNLRLFFNGNSVAVDQARGRSKLGYDKVNLRLGKEVFHWKSMHFYVYAGGRFLYLESTRSIRGKEASGQSDSQREQSQFTGGGVELGIGAILDLMKGLSLFGQASPTFALGSKKVFMNAFVIAANGTLASSVKIWDPIRLFCIPGLDLKLALRGWKDFTFFDDWCSFRLMAELGIELNAYRNALSHRRPTAPINSLWDEDLLFFGPYASLKIRF